MQSHTPSLPPAAVFFDRDGTLIRHKPYLSDPREVELLPGTREALGKLREWGTRLFLFTNQSGVARGLFGLAEVEAVNQRMIDLVGYGPDLFTSICIAPEGPDEPAVYRKPSPRFIEEMITAHAIPRHAAWMLGDSPVDWQAGINAGIRTAAIVSDPATETTRERRLALGIEGYVSPLAWADAVFG